MKKLLPCIIISALILCSCNQKNKGQFIVQSEVNNLEELEMKINKIITIISEAKSDEIIPLLNEYVELGPDMVERKDNIIIDFKNKGRQYSILFDSKLYYENYVKTKMIQQYSQCKEVNMSVKEALNRALKYEIVKEISKRDDDSDLAFVRFAWKPVDCPEEIGLVFYLSRKNDEKKWKLCNLNIRFGF